MVDVKVLIKGEPAEREALEKLLDALMDKLGLDRWASGYDLEEGIRDIAYETPKG